MNEPLSITVKRLDNGEFSRKLFDQTKEGDLLTTTGAAGFFVLPAGINQFKEIFFIAAGTGITPVLPLIKTILYRHPQIRVVLIYSNRSKHTTIFYTEITGLAVLFADRFTVEFLFSSAANLERARLSKWLLGRLFKGIQPGIARRDIVLYLRPF